MNLLPPWLGLSAEQKQALPRLWQQLVDEPSMISAIVEDMALPAERIQGWGVTLILPKPLVGELQLDRQPEAFVTRRVYQSLLDGRFRPMTDREIGQENAAGELTMLIMHFSARQYGPGSPYGHSLIAVANDTYRTFHDGYNLRAIYYETNAADQYAAVPSGFLRRRFVNEAELTPLPLEVRPAYFGLTRAEAWQQQPGPPTRNSFEHQPPLFCFSASQRRLLWFALFDESDEALMPLLDVSVHGLKKLWRGIYERIEDRMPAFFGDAGGGDDGKRGPEKRRQVMAYVRQRLEELRPWAPG
ncbi:hypothetical protein [Steroidobacter cummioxidans]|uniref:hypothetical protein n=1 Tax=Steroidobacter cummioxidans TaxID=1803913 RepID=UPI00129005FF|nr:hypothetical protein [Steroidobacter cummioxidans]